MPDAKSKKTLILAPAAFNLAEVTRMIEIAKAARARFDVVFTSYDGEKRNHRFIEGAGFAIRELEPQLDEATIQRWWRLDRGEDFGDMFEEDMLERRIAAEQALFRELEPAAVLTGFCLSIPISARLANVPLVWVTQTTWLAEYSEQFATWPDAVDYAPLRILPEAVRNALARKMTPVTYWLLNKAFSKAAERHGLPAFHGSSLVEGDYNLFAEPPEFSGVSVPARLAGKHRFIGPLIARLDVEVPAAVREMPKDLPIVYFAMGSSGVDTVIADIIRAFADKPYRVISPVANLLRRVKVEPPPNVVVTDWLPAHEVNPLADVSVIHGGVGTLMTACLAGTPIVGIPNGNPEQEANLECIVRKGFALHLHKRRLDPDAVIAAVDHMLHDEAAKTKARAFQAILRKWDGPTNAASFLAETFDA